MVVSLLQKEAPDLAGVKTFRLVCKQWQAIALDATTSVKAKGIEDKEIPPQQVTNMFSQLHRLRMVLFLPSRYLPCLLVSPSTVLEALILTGTGTPTLYETCLPQLASLQRIVFDGPMTMTDTLLSTLGSLPQLKQLGFHNVLFPRTAYPQSCFHDLSFKALTSLMIKQVKPLDHNGAESGIVGQQFLLSLPQLQHVAVKMTGVDQLLMDTLNSVTTLIKLTAVVPMNWNFMFAADEWSQWSKSRGVVFQWFNGAYE